MSYLTHLTYLTFLALLFAAAPVRAQESRDYVVVVLDCSGSMKEALAGTGQTKMEAAKVALKAVLQKVPQSTYIGLLVFGLPNRNQDWRFPLGPRNDAELPQQIDGLQPSSGTPLGAYIKKGADRLLEERQKQFGYGTYRLLVVTDGEAQDQKLVDQYTPEVIARGMTVDVIGVGMRKDHTLATKVHSYRRANDPASFQRAVSEVFAEIGNTAKDAAQADAFELLAPIPAEMAASMIQALSSSGNHPIGTRPAQPANAAPPQSSPPKPDTARPSNVAPIATAPPPAQSVPHTSSSQRGFPKWAIVIAVIIVLSFLSKRTKGARR